MVRFSLLFARSQRSHCAGAGVAFCLLLSAPGLMAADRADAFAASVQPVLKTYCATCHSGKEPKGDFAIDKLAPDFAKHADAWGGVLDHLTDGSMPPKGKPRPTATEQQTVTRWLAAGLAAEQAKK